MCRKAAKRTGRVETGGPGMDEDHSGAAVLNTAVRADGSLPLY